jgi:hypothetical protein
VAGEIFFEVADLESGLGELVDGLFGYGNGQARVPAILEGGLNALLFLLFKRLQGRFIYAVVRHGGGGEVGMYFVFDQ